VLLHLFPFCDGRYLPHNLKPNPVVYSYNTNKGVKGRDKHICEPYTFKALFVLQTIQVLPEERMVNKEGVWCNSSLLMEFEHK
jgi:hypothetical protein